MFEEKTFDVVGFHSTWKNEKVVENVEIQTTEFKSESKSTNTATSADIEVQTDIRSNTEEVDMEKLANWLKRIYPFVVEELNDNSLSNAMASCGPLVTDSNTDSIMLQKIDIVNESNKKEEDMFVSAISWNSTGNTLAVACSMQHKTWCHHEADVKLYTFIRNDQLPVNPNKKLICASCVTTLSFHPNQPAILCGGTVSGEIYIWNVQETDDYLLSTCTVHEDRVTLVSWVVTDSKSPILVSASLDTYLLLWKFNDSTLSIHQKYKPYHYLPAHKTSASTDVLAKKSEKGIILFDFSRHIPGLFVIGTEGGFILKCSLIGARLVSASKTSTSTLDPFISSYNAHSGELTSLSFCPHRKDLFFSSGTDNQIKIFNIEQESPVQIIFTNISLTMVLWIYCEPKLILGASEDGSLQLYSLLNGQSIDLEATFYKDAITVLAVNNKKVDMVIFGNDKGVLQLWSIPWNNIAAQDKINISRNKH